MISAVVLTKNEEENIKDCLAGLKWCDEIIVIDDNSSDKTVEIAKKEKARVYRRELAENFAEQRNFGLEKAKYDWIFFVDADERVSRDLAKEICETIKNPRWTGYFFKRIDYFLGNWQRHGEIGRVRILRLGRRGAGKWRREVDEKWIIEGKTKTLKNPLLHFSHKNITDFLESINERSTLNAKVFYQEGKRVNFFEWLKIPGKFLLNFIFRLGFLDGTPGFVFSVLMSFHSFLVRGKLYLLWRREGGWR